MAEMYSYCMSAAHHNLPHLTLEHYMISNPDCSGEGWRWVDELKDISLPEQTGIMFPNQTLPTFLHYCQVYKAKGIEFYKRFQEYAYLESIFTCASPILANLPGNYLKVEQSAQPVLFIQV